MRRWPLGSTMLAVAVGLAACAESSADVRGGELKFDPTPPVADEPNACPVKDEADAGSGAKWSDLYRDLFGPTGAAKCADPSCHGTAGTTASRVGILCADQAGCRESLLDKGWIQDPGDFTAPESSGFYTVLRRCDANNETVGTMPLRPASYHFSPASLARVATWLRNGAPND